MGVKDTFRLAVAALALTTGLPVLAANEAGKARVDWEKLSADQQIALKAGSPQVKQATTQNSHVYVDGVRKAVVVEGTGPQAVFRIEGMSTALRHSGRALVQTRTAQTLATLSALLDGSGLSPLRALDEAGTSWLVESKTGLEGLQQINQLQESGKVVRATPDWQRDLKTK